MTERARRQISQETRRRMSESAKRRCTPEWRKRMSEERSTDLPIEEVRALYEEGMTQDEIGQRFGVSQKAVWRFMKRHGINARAAAKRDQSGPKNSAWRGGKTMSTAGYVFVRSPQHPRADAGGYVQEHILVMERKLGRPLRWFGIGHPKSEIVHHVNGNKTDNRPENLHLTTFQDHLALHRSSETGQRTGGDAKCRH